jgi:ribosomal protein S27AE
MVLFVFCYDPSVSQNVRCPECGSWLLDHPTKPGYLKCVCCGYTREAWKQKKDIQPLFNPVI